MKFQRQSRLLDIIKNEEVETQDEIVQILLKEGYQVTQATISRDIRELKLIKSADASGRVRYSLPQAEMTPEMSNEKYRNILKHGYKNGETAGQMVVVRTLSGMAMAVAAAIDALGFRHVIGCIAGDDTIFCATRSVQAAEELLRDIKNLV
ncbi:arginine repressor [Clostridiales bacterium COT073_COT-073]|nr:arginine repressor [Clostridiales bacterium COT073_COT-073]